MEKNKRNYYFTAILLTSLLVVYFFKIDKEVFAFQEYACQPTSAYTEQPLSKKVLYFGCTNTDFSQCSKFLESEKRYLETISTWRAVSLAYNLRVHHALKHQISFSTSLLRVVSILYKKNIYHKSSEDDELCCCFA